LNGIPAETANTEAGAPAAHPSPAKKPRAAAQKAHVAPSKARSGNKGHPGEEGYQRREVGQVAQEGNRRPPGQQDRQVRRPAEALRRRHPEGTHESHRLAGALGPWVYVRCPGQEDGADGHVHQGRGRGASLLGQWLKPNESVFWPPGFRLGGLSWSVPRTGAFVLAPIPPRRGTSLVGRDVHPGVEPNPHRTRRFMRPPSGALARSPQTSAGRRRAPPVGR
jgi:hypothetical protein